MALSQGTQQWHPSMAPTSNGTQQWHRAMAPCPIRQSGSSPAPPIGSKNAYSYRYLGKYQINMVSRSDTAGQFLQTVALQVELFQTAEIPKKTFWKCSQAIALQMKFAQVTEIPKKTFWKCSQAIALQMKFAQVTEIPKKTFWKCSQAIALQVKFFQTAEMPKKTCWKCSQFVALQRQKQIQMLQAIEHSSRKLSLSQIHVCQIQGAATPATLT